MQDLLSFSKDLLLLNLGPQWDTWSACVPLLSQDRLQEVLRHEYLYLDGAEEQRLQLVLKCAQVQAQAAAQATLQGGAEGSHEVGPATLAPHPLAVAPPAPPAPAAAPAPAPALAPAPAPALAPAPTPAAAPAAAADSHYVQCAKVLVEASCVGLQFIPEATLWSLHRQSVISKEQLRGALAYQSSLRDALLAAKPVDTTLFMSQEVKQSLTGVRVDDLFCFSCSMTVGEMKRLSGTLVAHPSKFSWAGSTWGFTIRHSTSRSATGVFVKRIRAAPWLTGGPMYQRTSAWPPRQPYDSRHTPPGRGGLVNRLF